MTQDSRAAFEEFYNKHYDNIDSEFAANMQNSWQASEQRILDMLGSDEMVEVVAKAMCGTKDPLGTDDYKSWTDEATAALQAISKKLGE